jgi:hypothetical protein
MKLTTKHTNYNQIMFSIQDKHIAPPSGQKYQRQKSFYVTGVYILSVHDMQGNINMKSN